MIKPDYVFRVVLSYACLTAMLPAIHNANEAVSIWAQVFWWVTTVAWVYNAFRVFKKGCD